MDPVTAIGFASSILTFIDFSWDLITGTYEVYKSATGTTLENAHIGTVIDDLEKVTEDLSPDLELKTKHGKALFQLAEKCNQLSKVLSRILKKLQAGDKDSKWQSLKVKLASLRKEKEVASIEKRLDQYRSQIIIRLNFMLSEQQSSLKIQLDKIQSEGSHMLTESAKQFALVRTHLDQSLQDMLKDSGENANLQRNSETEQTNSLAEIRRALGELQTMVKLIPHENCILRRLYFKSMYTREDTVADAETGTFAWLVESGEKSDNSPELDEDETKGGDYHSSQYGEDSHSQAMKNTRQLEPDYGATESDAKSRSHSSQDEDNLKESPEDTDILVVESTNDNKSIISQGREDQMTTELHNQTRAAFLAWLATGSGIYHISGKAGSGKSTLMKLLSKHPRVQSELETWAGTKRHVFANFFFWSSGDRLQMSLEGLYRSILFEILRQCPELIHQIFPSLGDMPQIESVGMDNIPLRLPELKAAFNTLVGNQNVYKHRFCFFIDGLDEFEGDSFQQWELARSLQRWTKSDDVKMCVSSRPHTEFMATFSDDDSLRIRLHEITSGDIKQFALAMFEKDENLARLGDLSAELVEDIVNMADGVFLWARLVIHSLLDGIGNHYPASALKDKLNAIPKDLEKLFDSLLDAVDPGDRKRSDKLLLIAIIAAKAKRATNAMAYTWIDDLKDPMFPFSSPVRGCSDEEIDQRHEDLRYQLSSLSKGLLEMTVSDEDDVYFKYDVQFFHRSVRDFLEQPSRHNELQHRIPDFDPVEAYSRLKLADFKFARMMAASFGHKESLYRSFGASSDNELKSSSQKARFELLDEYGRILGSLRRDQFSNPSEAERNTGHLHWGCFLHTNTSLFLDGSWDEDISYLHWLTNLNQGDYVREVVSENHALAKGTQTLNLLLTSAMSGDQETTTFLLENGAKPHQHVFVRDGQNQSEEVWMIFLISLAAWSLRLAEGSVVNGPFRVLECFLKFGEDSDVFFLVYKREYNTQQTALEIPDKELFVTTLRQLVQLYEPPNHQSIIDLLQEKEASSLWRRTKRAILTLSSWNRPLLDVASKYKAIETDKLGGYTYLLHSVLSGTSRIYPGFKVRIF